MDHFAIRLCDARKRSSIRDPMHIHAVFDVLALISAGLMGWYVSRQGWLQRGGVVVRTPFNDPPYFAMLGIGGISGAFVLGSLNLELAGHLELDFAIGGAICGAIVLSEAYKIATGFTGSAGLQWVAPLALGIAIGRWGCFFAGLPDHNYGTPTTLPWGVDFGDGVPRHPVQLYESFAMLAFLLIYLREIARGNAFVLRKGSYLFVAWYALQRLAWGFLKPFPAVVGPFNTVQLICFGLLLYCSFTFVRKIEPLQRAA
jgi:hypothetical protein